MHTMAAALRSHVGVGEEDRLAGRTLGAEVQRVVLA
jgi:hypothetical protein